MARRTLRPTGFLRARGGASAIEFALVAPVLALVLFSAAALFLLYRESYRAEAATFTVADILSRRNTVDATFLNTTYAMFLKMLPADAAKAGFRVSSLKMTGRELKVDWSFPIHPLPALTDAKALSDRLPTIAEGDSLVVVETSVAYRPVIDLIGLGSGSHVNVASNRPRFTAAIAYTP
jgi:hypothetical protein